MKMHIKALPVLAAAYLFINSCKLDKAVIPSDAYTDVPSEETVIGISVKGTTVNNAYLTSVWKTAVTVQQYYDSNDIVTGATIISNKFDGIIFNDKDKTVNYTGLPTDIAPSKGTYVLSTTTNILFMQLSADPFSRSENTPIRITGLSSTAMTLVAIDPAFVSVDGQPRHRAYQVTFVK